MKYIHHILFLLLAFNMFFFNAEAHQNDVKRCRQKMVAIGEAIEAYQQEQGDFPEWLSDLHPKYLADEAVLICPADNVEGKAVLETSNRDPRLPVSYGYAFHPRYRAVKSEERLVYGDVIPLLRCRHHANETFDYLNLSFSYKFYTSASRYTPEEIYGSPAAAIRALETTVVEHPDDPRFFRLYRDLIRLYMHVENTQAVDALLARLKSSTALDIKGYLLLFDGLVKTKRYEDMLEIFKAAEQLYPNAQPIHTILAYVYRQLRNMELATVYAGKADTSYELIGKPVPDFTATNLDGNPISIQDYRGKVVLLDFWAVWCAPCIAEIPNVKRVYDTYKDEGFDVIGVSLDFEETILRDYIQTNDIQWRQIFDTLSVARQYGILAIPAPWLIDREGKLITPNARGHDLERLVVEALKEKSTH